MVRLCKASNKAVNFLCSKAVENGWPSNKVSTSAELEIRVVSVVPVTVSCVPTNAGVRLVVVETL